MLARFICSLFRMEGEKLTLYHSPRSLSAKVVWLIAEEPSLEKVVGLQHVVTSRGEQNTPEFRKINPMGKIPSLSLGGGGGAPVLSESTAICVFLLEHAAPQSALLPAAGSVARARVYELAAFSVTAELVLQPGFRQLMPHYTPVEQRSLAAGQESLDRFRTEVAPWVRERMVGPYYLGETFTVCDVLLGFLLNWFLMPLWDEHASRGDDPYEDFALYVRRVTSRPSWALAA